jgi:acetoin utilization deacetylase AcuC-like enzyme
MTLGLIYDPLFLEHETGAHPENAERLRTATGLLQAHGLWDVASHLPAEPASFDLLATVHQPGYLRFLEQVATAGGGWLTADTVMSARSLDVARLAAGAAVTAVESVARRDVDTAFAMVRPPGHHARPGEGMGFCLLNSAAVAARHAIRRLGLERVLVVDFDVHHGNGTQEIFYDDPTVCYVSIHQFPAYPGTGALEETGTGAGRGLTVNLPLPAGVGDEGYVKAFDELLAPVVKRFRPQLILTSAGYDAHWTNTAFLSSIRMCVSVTGFGEIVRRLRDWAGELCEGRLAFVLEGGYDPEALGWSIAATLRVLRDEPFDDPLGLPPNEEPVSAEALQPLWRRFQQIHGLQ